MVIKTYDSVGALIDAKVHKVNEGHSCAKRNFGEPGDWSPLKWLGCESIKQVQQFTEHGWKDGRQKAHKALNDIGDVQGAQSIRKRRRFGESGDELDIQKVYSGSLDKAWQYSRREHAASFGVNIVKILCDISALCDVSAEKMFWRGAVASILADKLEDAGYRAEIVAFSHTSGTYTDNSGCYIEVMVKQPDEYLDLDRVICATALSGFMRYYIFKSKLSDSKKADGGLGRPKNEPYKASENDIAITNIWDVNSAQNFLEKTIGNFNGN